MEQKPNEASFEKMVLGANQLAHFNVRCPSCNKLFRIESREIKSASPHFDCNACKTRFTFDFPPISANKVETRVVSQTDTFQLEDSIDREAMPELRRCPKCNAMNPRLTKDCIKCGIIFEKVEKLGSDGPLGAIPSLVKAWQDLMGDYDNLKKHMSFVHRCEDLQALPFALKKYESLKEAQPQDPLAQQMFHQVLLKNFKTRAQKMAAVQNLQSALATINWSRLRKLAPLVIGLSLILVGLSRHTARNLIGIGAAVLFLSIGLTVFIKGRISLEDFW